MSQLPAEIFKAYDIRGIVGKSLTAVRFFHLATVFWLIL